MIDTIDRSEMDELDLGHAVFRWTPVNSNNNYSNAQVRAFVNEIYQDIVSHRDSSLASMPVGAVTSFGGTQVTRINDSDYRLDRYGARCDKTLDHRWTGILRLVG